jgi:hypothetical protein
MGRAASGSLAASNRRLTPRTALLSGAFLLLFVAPGCSRIRGHFFGHTVTRKGTLTVSPPAGTIGTAFTFTAAGFRPGEPMTFEVDLPNHTRFVGPSHTAATDGRVSSTYTPQGGDPPGTYKVQAVGSRGTRAQSELTVRAGAAAGPSG